MVEEKLVQFRISGDALTKLQELKKKHGTDTMAEIFRRALRTYLTLEEFKQSEAGYIELVDKKGKRVRMLLP